MKTNLKEIPEIIKRAMLNEIADIGQLSKEDKKLLDEYVKKGVLIKGKGGPYPTLKIVYAIKGHDFAEARKSVIEELMRIIDYETKHK